MPNYVYVISRLKMSESSNYIFGGLMCHYGENNDVFPIGGLVELNDRLYLAKVLSGLMKHEPVKIYIYVTYVLERDFMWRGRHNTIVMAKNVVDHLN